MLRWEEKASIAAELQSEICLSQVISGSHLGFLGSAFLFCKIGMVDLLFPVVVFLLAEQNQTPLCFKKGPFVFVWDQAKVGHVTTS